MKTQFKSIFVILLFSVGLQTFVSAQPNAKSVVFYLQNLPYERIGSMSDNDSIDSIGKMGYRVLPVACSRYPRTSPELEEELIKFHENSPAILGQYYTSKEISALDVFYVPEGYILKRQIPIWNIKEHGAEGSLDYVMSTYNKEIVEKYGVTPVTNPDDMVGKDGTPIDYTLYMHVVYPSGTATKKVPLMMMFSASSSKQGSLNPVKEKQSTRYRNIFPLGFLTSGYAFAIADHCYNPLAHSHVYAHFDRYDLDNWNGLASTTAYIRYLNKYADEYNLNSKIGVMGISKAAYSAVRSADKLNADGVERSMFNNTPNTKPQPWEGYPSTVDVAYAAAGNGSRWIPQYVNENTVPMVTSVGLTDQYGHWSVYPEIVRHFKKIDNIQLSFWMEDLGHDYPCIGTDLATGLSRYRLTKEYFDMYLKPAVASNPLKVFYVLPKENSPEVNHKGFSRVLAPDNILPSDIYGISPYDPITVRFLSSLNINNIKQYVKVYHKSSNIEIEGTWTSSMRNTVFQFKPTGDMIVGDIYKIVVSGGLQNEIGQTLPEDFVREFSVTTVEDFSEPEPPSIENGVFFDDFERGSISVGGYPMTYYNISKKVISGTSPADPEISVTSDHGGRLRIPNRKGEGNAARVWVTGELASYSSPFKNKLNEIDADSVVWTYNIRNNSSTEYLGFDDNQRAIATILVATGSDLSTASGYAITYGGTGSAKRYRLVKFTGGLDANAKVQTIIAMGSDLASNTGYFSIKATYIPATNTWKLHRRLDASSSTGTYKNPITDTSVYTRIGEAVDNTFTTTAMSHFGFLLNYIGTGDYIQFYDNYAVRVFGGNSSGIKYNTYSDFYKIRSMKNRISIEANDAVAILYDARGMIIGTRNIKGSGSFESIQQGLYILRIESNEGISDIRKVVIH